MTWTMTTLKQWNLSAAMAAGLLGASAMAIEQPAYETVGTFDAFEVRAYGTMVVAETEVKGGREEAGNEGFRRLAGYIFGGNKGARKLAMTAPVTQKRGEKLAMTAPVKQTATSADTWVVQFVMPSTHTLDTLPEPNEAQVRLREAPAKRVAVRRYSGGWSESLYLKELAALRAALANAGLEPRGEPVWARYDPPYMPWFLRTNEIHIEVGPVVH